MSSKPLMVRLSAAQHAALSLHAAASDTTMAAIVRDALAEVVPDFPAELENEHGGFRVPNDPTPEQIAAMQAAIAAKNDKVKQLSTGVDLHRRHRAGTD